MDVRGKKCKSSKCNKMIQSKILNIDLSEQRIAPRLWTGRTKTGRETTPTEKKGGKKKIYGYTLLFNYRYTIII